MLSDVSCVFQICRASLAVASCPIAETRSVLAVRRSGDFLTLVEIIAQL